MTLIRPLLFCVLEIDPIVLASINPAPGRVTYKCKVYLLHPGVCNIETLSVIWSLGKEYERNKNKFWRCDNYLQEDKDVSNKKRNELRY